jgi:hypothetical protein
MPSLRGNALLEFSRTRRLREETEHLAHQEACEAAVKAAYDQFGFYPEATTYSPQLRVVVCQFDEGATRLARLQHLPWAEWRVLFECESCGGLVLGGRAVRDLSDIGRELDAGPTPDDFDRHICDPERAREKVSGRPLSEYLADAEARNALADLPMRRASAMVDQVLKAFEAPDEGQE